MPSWACGQRLRCALALGALLNVTDCHRTSEDSVNGFPRTETFYIAGWQWGEPASFNPLVSNPDWPVNRSNLLYEPLLLEWTRRCSP